MLTTMDTQRTATARADPADNPALEVLGSFSRRELLELLTRSDPADDLTLESINDTAKALGCCKRTVYKLIEGGDLRTVHIGRRQLIPRGERLRFVRKQLNR